MSIVKVEMYIPEYPVQPFHKLKSYLGALLEGYTEYPAGLGQWRSPSGERFVDDVVVITAVVEERMLPQIEMLLMEYKEAAAQQAVFYTHSPVEAVYL